MLVNVASMLGRFTAPYWSIGGAKKAFVLSFNGSAVVRDEGQRTAGARPLPGADEHDVLGHRRVYGSRSERLASYQSPDRPVRAALRALDRRTPPPSIISGGANRLTAAMLSRVLSRRAAADLAGALFAPTATR